MLQRRALITGVTGQDGSYLAEQLLADGVTVCGVVRCVETGRTRLAGWLTAVDEIELQAADITDSTAMEPVLKAFRPTEIYHLAAMSRVSEANLDPVGCYRTNVLGTAAVLAATRCLPAELGVRVLLAGSSEIFAGSGVAAANEQTVPVPISPYGVSKLAAMLHGRAVRAADGLPVCTAILFNHESPRRGVQFVTRKVTHAVRQIAAGRQRELVLGNIDIERDWGFAPDYTRGMQQLLRHAPEDEMVFATGELRSLREFLTLAFSVVGLDWREYTKTASEFQRAVETPGIRGDAKLARERLGWQPSITFEELVRQMMTAEMIAVE